MPVGVRVTVVADRGFGNGPVIRCVGEELGFDYVLRIRGDFHVTSAKGVRRLASQWVGAKGRSRALLRYYAKRWGIETSFRDI